MKKHSQKILRILAITSMLAIFTQATLVSASTTANVTTSAEVTVGTLTLTVASGTAALKSGSLNSGGVCSGSADPSVSLLVVPLCSNIGAITVSDLRSYAVGWSLNTELKHLTYVENTVQKLTGSTLTNISGVSPFDVDTGPYNGDYAHPNNKNSLYKFQITTAGGRAGSDPAGSYNMTRPDGTTSGATAIPSNGNVVDGGLTFNFAAFAHVIGDVYIVTMDAIHMFDRPAQGSNPAITATTKFRPTAVTAVGASSTTNVALAADNDDVAHLGGGGGNQFTQSEILNILSAPNNFGKGAYTVSVGIETLLYANSSASNAFTAQIVLELV